MYEKNIWQRAALCIAAAVAGVLLIYPPQQRLRPGLDIAGGTSLIFEIDATDAEGMPDLAERVKEQLQRRVDPAGVYNLVWRVHGQNRIEVQMPLPPRDARARREAFAKAQDELFKLELRRGEIEAAIALSGAEREAALRKLAEGRSAEALAAIKPDDAEGPARRQAIEQVVATRQARLNEAAARYDAYVRARAAYEAAQAAAQGPTTEPTEPAATPELQQAEESLRDATELWEDAVEAVLATNLNRRRFNEVLELEPRSQTRVNSLRDVLTSHADLFDKIEAAVAAHTAYRQGKRFLDGPADLKRLLRGSGKLEFRILAQPSPENVTKYDRLRRQLREGQYRVMGDTEGWFKIDNPLQFFNFNSPQQLREYNPLTDALHVVDKQGDDYYVLASLRPQDGLLAEKVGQRWTLRNAAVDRDENGRLCVRFRLDPIGGQMFEVLTRNNLERQLCIFVDDIAYSSARIQSPIRTDGQITGEFSLDKVNYLVRTMEGGTLPGRLKDTPLSERTIGSSLGEANRDSALRSGVIGAIAVILIMVLYYHVSGVVALIALALNVLLVLAIVALLGARLTLDGIAGIVLSIGMGVDANVLIYERMREERDRGSSLRLLFKNGYDKAFTTIFDSNMTTLLTCVIIYYVGSEEVKGFGLTLGWGIVLNLFTSVFVTRTIFTLLLKYNLIKNVSMLRIIGIPNIDWYGLRRVFIPVSVVVITVGLFLLYQRGKRDVFDVEFLGGVAAEIELKQAGLNDRTIGSALARVGQEITTQAQALGSATVELAPGEVNVYRVRAPGIDAPRLAAFITEPLEAQNMLLRGGVSTAAGDDHVVIRVQPEITAERLTTAIRALGEGAAKDGRDLARANINAVLETGGQIQPGLVWNVVSTVTNMRLVENALASAIGDQMRIQPRIEYIFRGDGDRPFPITDRRLARVVPDLPPGIDGDLTNYLGGAAIRLDDLDPPLTLSNLSARLENMHFQPDFQNIPKRDFELFGIQRAGDRVDESGEPLYESIVVVSVDPEARYTSDPKLWLTQFAQSELALVKSALSTEQTLRKVMQFKPQIAARATQQAAVALILAWAMIIAYVWIRFGKPVYGIAGVVALVHDVLVALAAVGLSGWIGGANNPLLIGDFKIDMTVIAALLTIIGFSINDTIVIFDRVREVKGRLGVVTPEVINAAVNQCMSRTILTTFTTITVVAIMYIFGGPSIRGFNFCMLVGLVSGVYSTVAIASPLLLLTVGTKVAASPARR